MLVSPNARVRAAACCLVLLCAARAHASGFMATRFGGEHGHPTTASPTAVYYNPAALVLGDTTRIYIEGQLGVVSLTYERPPAPTDAPVPDDAQGANTGVARLSEVAVAPGLAGKTRLGSFALGLGVYAPFGGAGTFDKNEVFRDHPTYPSAYDGVQRFSVVSGSVASAYFTAAVAYALEEPRLAFGVSANLVYTALQADAARTTAGDNNLISETRILTELSGLQWSIGLGVLYEPVKDRVWIGASYQSPPLPETLSGDFTQSIAGGVSTQPAEVDYSLPDVVRLGVRYAPSDAIELRLFGDYTRWSVYERLCLVPEGGECSLQDNGAPEPGAHVLANLPRHWSDAFGARAGASYWPVELLELFAGAGVDSNPVPDSTLDATSSFGANVSGALGARVRAVHGFHLAASYTHLYYLPRDNVGKSRLANFNVPSRSPDAGGRYDQWVGLIHLSTEVSF